MNSDDRRHGFTLVELLVVIGIIGVLIALLLPAISGATRQSNKTKCASNLRQLGITLLNYAQTSQGWLFPVGPAGPDGRPTTLGTNVPPNERWPVLAFNLKRVGPMPFDPIQYNQNLWPNNFSAQEFSPAVLLCPDDPDAVEFHSYVLNKHLADYRIRAGDRNFGLARSTSEVVWAGEKKTLERDYYMENAQINSGNEFDRVVEKYRHSIKLGSNYLYLDGSVRTEMPDRALTGIDPWTPGGLTPVEPTLPAE
ncbi:MAG TPA: type II secretion system protein [Tepidisphaeraceae bacterium]|nr:type II secretion system protein [Tepidisphaeraceae bacterium]